MARLRPAPPDTYVPLFGEDAHERLRVYAHRPELALQMAAFNEALRTHRILPDRLVELVRLRVAFWNQCRSCMATRYTEGIEAGVTEALVCSLERPEEADDLSDAERAAIAYADRMATDHLSIDDATFDGLREHFTEAEIVELCFNVAWFVGFGRMAATMQWVDDLPERFRADGRVTPWGDGGVVVA